MKVESWLVLLEATSVPAFQMENKIPSNDGETKAKVKFPTDDVQSVKLPPMSMSQVPALSGTSNNTLNKNEGKLCDVFLILTFLHIKHNIFSVDIKRTTFCHFPQCTQGLTWRRRC